MNSIDNEYQLNFTNTIGDRIVVNQKLLDKLKFKDLSLLPEGTELLINENYIYDILFRDKSELKIFRIPTKCNFLEYKKNILIFSFEHLKLILNAFKYNNPSYYSKYSKKEIVLDINKIEESKFFRDKIIEIKEKQKQDYKDKISYLFKKLSDIYSKKSDKDYTYQYISTNYKVYFSSNIEQTNIFDYYYSNNRELLEQKFDDFLNNEKKLIYPICGPHGIGKSISSLIIQKAFFIRGIKSLYLNLKYYYLFNKNWEEQLEVLIKECFFIVEKEEELLQLYENFKNAKEFTEGVNIIKEYLNKKKYRKKQFYIILDQFNKKYNINNILDSFKDFKIFLLSSINDSDVKQNLLLKYQEEMNKAEGFSNEITNKNIIEYEYYEDLVDRNFFQNPNFKGIIMDKIRNRENKGENNENINIKYNFIMGVLKQFSYIPKYVFSFINNYDTIYDLLFNEYIYIFKKLQLLVSTKTLNLSELFKLEKNGYLIEKNKDIIKTLNKELFIKFIPSLPLKYINFHLCENKQYYYYYSFPFFKNILEEFNDFTDAKKSFYINEDGRAKREHFKKILKIQFKIYNKFMIDGYFEVDKLTNMEVGENYKYIDEKYINSKNIIFINQNNRDGKDYDFAIYKTKQKQLILIGLRYNISYDSVQKKSSYKSHKIVSQSFYEKFKIKINEIYLLYISDYEANFKREKSVYKILNLRYINCLFYNVFYDYFSFDFKNRIDILECEESFRLEPKSNIYFNQENSCSYEIKKNENDLGEKTLLLKKRKKDRQIKNLKKIYLSIINFITNKSYLYLKDIINDLGDLEEIRNFSDSEDGIIINEKTEYVFLFIIKNISDDKEEIDFDKPIGLIYSGGGSKYKLDLKSGINYENCDDLAKNFKSDFYYGIGTKKNI